MHDLIPIREILKEIKGHFPPIRGMEYFVIGRRQTMNPVLVGRWA
jgi:hypothetical protein